MHESIPKECAEFFERENVSRETIDRLSWYAQEFRRWTTKINLVSAKTLPEFWNRHILDSAQLFPLLSAKDKVVADIGSGGGLPGLVLAILDGDHGSMRLFELVDADKRKAAFLSHVARNLNLAVGVQGARIETIEPVNADAITSRALASVTKLIALGHRHLRPGGHFIFLKGEKSDDEINSALESWQFTYEKQPSISHMDSSVIVIPSPVAPRESA